MKAGKRGSYEKPVRLDMTFGEALQRFVREGEESVVRKFRITANDGKTYETLHYSLDAILSVGYRVLTRKMWSDGSTVAGACQSSPVRSWPIVAARTIKSVPGR
jgi:hypothetical protein